MVEVALAGEVPVKTFKLFRILEQKGSVFQCWGDTPEEAEAGLLKEGHILATEEHVDYFVNNVTRRQLGKQVGTGQAVILFARAEYGYPFVALQPFDDAIYRGKDGFPGSKWAPVFFACTD